MDSNVGPRGEQHSGLHRRAASEGCDQPKDVTNQRRSRIVELLSQKKGAVNGTELAQTLSVSRQVIVQDIALLRACGVEIIATPQGYILVPATTSLNYRKTIACRHDKNNIKEELTTIVDEGGMVRDVIIEHAIYGQICGNIMISSRREIEEFMKKIEADDAKPLSDLTLGVHLHTIECKNEETMNRIEQELDKKGLLLK